MRIVTSFQCEKCNKIYKETQEAVACEAKHLNLTVEKYKEYLFLQENAARAGVIVSMHKNKQTDEEFDKACKALTDFEQKHNLVK